MYYGPQGNRIHSWLLTKKSFHRYAGLCITIISLIIMWVFFIYQPLMSLIDVENLRALSAQEKAGNGIHAQKRCKELEQKIKEHRSLLEQNSSGKCSGGHLSLLVEQALKCGVIIGSCSSAHEFLDGESEHCILNYRLYGTFQQLLSFFDELVQSEAYLGCTHLTLAALADNQFDISCQFES